MLGGEVLASSLTMWFFSRTRVKLLFFSRAGAVSWFLPTTWSLSSNSMFSSVWSRSNTWYPKFLTSCHDCLNSYPLLSKVQRWLIPLGPCINDFKVFHQIKLYSRFCKSLSNWSAIFQGVSLKWVGRIDSWASWTLPCFPFGFKGWANKLVG